MWRVGSAAPDTLEALARPKAGEMLDGRKLLAKIVGGAEKRGELIEQYEGPLD